MSSLAQIKFPVAWDPITNTVYVDEPSNKYPTFGVPLINMDAYMSSIGVSKAASVNSPLEEIYFNNGKEEHNFLDQAIGYTDQIHQIQQLGSPLERR
jgi:hypothetical protein